MLPVFCIFFIIGGVLASPIANNYVDNLLAYTLKSQIASLNLDPARIPDFNTEFKDKVLFVKVKGKANYTDGTLSGLSKVYRYGECFGPSNVYGTIRVNCTIALSNLQTHFNAKMKYGKLPAVPVKANANITNTILFVEFARQQGTNVGQLAKMEFRVIGEAQPKFTGLGKTLNKYLTVLANGYKIHVNAEMMNVITNSFHYALNMAAGQLPMPT